MTSKDRIINAMKFKKVDYIPVMCKKRAVAPQTIGRKYDREFQLDPEAMAKSAIEIWKIVKDDAFCLGAGPAIQMGLGCDLNWPEDDHPSLKNPVITTKEEALKLEVPDIYSNEYMSAFIEAVRLLYKWAGDEVPIKIASYGIFNILSRLLGVERMMQWIIKDRETIQLLCDKINETMLKFAKEMRKEGALIYEIGDAMSGPALISPQIFKELSVPNHKAQIDGFKEMGYLTMLHVCGGEYPVIDQLQYTNADFLWFSELVDLSVAQKIFYKRFAVCGGVHPVDTLFVGGPEDVDRDIKELISGLKHKSGVIIMPGCGLSSNISIENLKAMAQATQKYSELAGKKVLTINN
ncbi:methyltransferase, MtaA/CmuA family [Acetitomaculum ruminis DSM 5522]|uniref:Methyltransferase, MtaA/CmuA family n=1 Tax=Acetitomaculum ruminis DSM 5522 TaxID=1120918 RepID=A0A1I1A3L1_9FIRM|nr:uroporphyrinogen decarboxylase family protein [Acetitomaculum ruminis]SFB31936.1 methyltransferase, MtaA/CmuA family [Acetitomaculum ruminis DSM 5522]